MSFGPEENEAVAPDELRDKVEEYTTFITETLHPELRMAVFAREEIESEISEYQEIQENLSIMSERETPQPVESMVNLGYEKAYCHAEVNDPETVFVHVGMEFHVEFTLDEAFTFIDKRARFLEKKLADRADRAQAVSSHLESSLLILEALAKHLRDTEKMQNRA